MAKKPPPLKVAALGAWPQDKEGKDLDFVEHDELKAFGDEIIKTHHADLVNVRIRYAFQKKAINRVGNRRPGSIKKLGGINRKLFKTDALVVVGWEPWDAMETAGKMALMDHLMSHLVRDVETDGSGVLHFQEPPVAEFPSVITRHGAWSKDLLRLGHALQQLQFDFNKPVEEDGEPEAASA